MPKNVPPTYESSRIFELNNMEEFLVALTGDKETVKRFFNPIVPEYQKKLEARGWEFVGNVSFSSMMDKMDGLELVYGNDIIPAKNTLREKMRMKREWIRKKESAEKVVFFRAYDPSGNRIPNEELYVGVYVKRLVG